MSTIRITRPDASQCILAATDRMTLAIRAGTAIEIDGRSHAFEHDTDVDVAALEPGRDYVVTLAEDGRPTAALADGWPLDAAAIGGFHFARFGNAVGTGGGDGIPAINPHSIWDIGFRPACQDPRGMALVEMVGGRRFWADIYLLGVDHHRDGTSRCGVTIADGRDRPMRPDGSGHCAKLNYATACEIYAHHGKRLLGAEEFFAAAYGVKERCSLDDEPEKTGARDGESERFVSRHGLHGVTGTMWQWGTDGHPDEPRPSLFGGSWMCGGDAGSRYAYLGFIWPENSDGLISSRGACDHLGPV